MKKNLLLGIMLLVATGLSAQMYVGLGFGYHLAAQNQVLGSSYNSAGDESNIYGSMGNGFIPALKFGYMFNDNWGFELGFSALFGAKNLVGEDMEVPSGYTSYEEKIYAQARGYRLMPSFVFKTDAGVYSRVGLIVPLGGKTMVYDDVSYSVAGTSGTISAERENHGFFTLGFTGALGYGYELNDQMTIFGEFEYVGLRFYGKTASITKYEVNGADKLADLKPIQKETEFVDEVKTGDNQDPEKPYKALKSATPYSSFGINLGLIYKL